MDLIFPKILSDEFLGGYRGRIAALNGLQTPLEVARAVARVFPQAATWNDQVVTFVEAAAAFNGMQPLELLRRHTCMLVQLGFDEFKTHPKDSVRAISRQWAAWLYCGVHRPRACPECIADDLSRYKFAHWHRSHQLAGRFICPLHECALWDSARQQLLPAGPQDVVERRTPFEHTTFKALKENRYVKSALGILEKLLHEEVQLDRNRCAHVLRNQVCDLTRHTRESIPQLGTRIVASLDPAWMDYCMPAAKLDRQTMTNLLKRIVYADTRRPSFTDLALVTSVAYDTPRDALSAIISR